MSDDTLLGPSRPDVLYTVCCFLSHSKISVYRGLVTVA